MFNKKEFKDRTLNKEWNIHHVKDGFTHFYDEKFNTYIINNNDFLNFIINNNITIIDKKFSFNAIVSTTNRLYTEKEYNEWLSEYNSNLQNEINKDDLKEGYIYQLEDKTTYFLFLGVRYTVSWKYSKKDNAIILSKPQKKYIGYELIEAMNFTNKSYAKHNIKNIKSSDKVIKEIKKYEGSLNSLKLLEYIKTESNIVYMNKEKPLKKIEFIFKKMEINLIKGYMKNNDLNEMIVFNRSGDYFIKNKFHYEFDIQTNNQVRKSDSDRIVFHNVKDNQVKKHNEKEDIYGIDTLLCQLCSRSGDSDTLLAPMNYYVLSIK